MKCVKSVLFLFFLASLFISCQNDNELDLIGLWSTYESKKIDCDDSTQDYGHSEVKFTGPCSSDMVLLCSYHEYNFFENGEVAYFENGGVLGIYFENSYQGTWSRADQLLTICLVKGDEECVEYELNETKNGFELIAPPASDGCVRIQSYRNSE